jgi:hypothetical protein
MTTPTTHRWRVTVPGQEHPIDVWSGSKDPNEIRGDVAVTFNVPADRVTVRRLT